MTAPIEDHSDQRLAIATAEGAPARFWPMVREALAGSRRDLTAMPLGRAVLLLAVPMVLEMVMESIFAVADIFWVSRLGADAVATVGLTESMLTIVYALAMGLAIGVGGGGGAPHRREGPRRAPRAPPCRRSCSASALSVVVGVAGALRRAAPAGAHGRVARRAWRSARATRRDHARRQRHRGPAVPDQRRLPRRRRRGDRHAHALAGQRHQHRARAVLHLRARPGAAHWASPARRSPPPSAAASACCISCGAARAARAAWSFARAAPARSIRESLRDDPAHRRAAGIVADR